MKKFLSLALAAIIAISANAKKVETAQFSSVKVNAPVHLVMVPGREYSVNIVSRNPQLTTAVSWTVKNGVLTLNARDLESLEQSNATVEVFVTSPNALDYQLTKDVQKVSSRKHKLGWRRGMRR
ncbi:MAG: hypothetical protein IJ693_03925 [Bacteroidaceae bacterium]|nr:hypothetical protein [Bacteroidaceae bacterium]